MKTQTQANIKEEEKKYLILPLKMKIKKIITLFLLMEKII